MVGSSTPSRCARSEIGLTPRTSRSRCFSPRGRAGGATTSPAAASPPGCSASRATRSPTVGRPGTASVAPRRPPLPTRPTNCRPRRSTRSPSEFSWPTSWPAWASHETHHGARVPAGPDACADRQRSRPAARHGQESHPALARPATHTIGGGWCSPSDGHLDPDALALLALGEPPTATGPHSPGTADAEAHLRVCTVCRAELDQLAALVHTGRTVTREDEPQRPPESVWRGIVDELGL